MLGEFDIIVHSGDFLPTKGRRMGERIRPVAEIRVQERWLRKKKEEIRVWSRGKRILFCRGNHDFVRPEAWLREEIDFVNITDKLHEEGGISFYGFPYIPYDDGEWVGELRDPLLLEEVRKIPKVNVLVAHCPPHGILDMEEGVRWGNKPLLDEFEKVRPQDRPRVILCGHVHDSCGVTRWGPIYVINSATTARLVHVG